MRGQKELSGGGFLGKKLDASQIQRARELEYCLGISVLKSGDETLAGLLELASNDDLPVPRRSGLILLLLGGRYPLQEDLDAVSQGISLGNPSQALSAAYRATRDSRTTARILQVDRDVVDVTRYSATRRISGIPRVVKNLISSESFADTSLGVWEGGVLGLAHRLPRGMVKFSKDHWKRPSRRRGGLALLYLRLAPNLLASVFGLKILRFLDLVLRPLLREINSGPQGPKFCILLTNQTLFIPEVPEESISRSLFVWKQVFPELKISMVVHDLLPMTHPQYFTARTNREHLYYLALMSASNHLFVGTKVLEREVAEKLPSSSEALPRIAVLPLPVSIGDANSGSNASDSAEPYFLFFGGFEKRKALSGLVQYMKFVSSTQLPFRIIVLGSPWPGQGADIWRTAEEVLNLPEIFGLVGSVDDQTLATLVSGASGVLYLSHAEGYGLPILEALSFGKIVLTQDTPTNREMGRLYGGVWPEFRFDDLRAFQAMVRCASTKDPFQEMAVGEPNLGLLPTDLAAWAKTIRDSSR